MIKKLSDFILLPNESWKENLPFCLTVAGLLIFLGFMGVSKALLNLGASIVCAGIVLQLILQGPKSFLILNSKPLCILLFLVFGWLFAPLIQLTHTPE